MTESTKKNFYAQCSRCRRETFADLLDENGLCEYCSAIRRTKSQHVVGKRERKMVKRKDKSNYAAVTVVKEKDRPPRSGTM